MHPQKSRLAGDGQKRPSNVVRLMPTLSFSLMPHQVEAIRDAAMRQQVSQSQVVRAALDQFFPGNPANSSGEDHPRLPRPQNSAPGTAQLVRELAGLRRELTELRQLLAQPESESGSRTPTEFPRDRPNDGEDGAIPRAR